MRPTLLLLIACADPGEALDDDTTGTSPDDTGFVSDDTSPLGADALMSRLQALQAIADDHGGNRAMGTPGYDASVDYVMAELEAVGLSPWREPFEVRDWTIDGGEVTWADTGVDDEDLGAMVWSAGGTATGSVVPVDLTIPPPPDANTSTSGCEAADFSDFPTGEIALIQRGSCSFALKVANAEAAGATAVLIFNEGQSGRTEAVQGNLDGDARPNIPVLGLSHDAGVALATVDDPVTVTVDAEVIVIPQDNVLVDVPGTSGARYAIGAHLDSVPDGPGINDNGTGVATLLQLAARLAEADTPTHGARFALWGAEEVGLVGSLAHARAMSEADLDDTLGYLNFDMVGSPNPARFVMDGDGSTIPVPEWLPLADGSATIEQHFVDHFDALDKATAPTAYDGRSDYLGFAQLGLPTGGTFTGAEQTKPPGFVEFFGGTGGEPYDPCYHRSCDTLDNVNVDALVEMAAAAADVLDTLIEIEIEPETMIGPTLVPHMLPTVVAGSCGHEHLER